MNAPLASRTPGRSPATRAPNGSQPAAPVAHPRRSLAELASTAPIGHGDDLPPTWINLIGPNGTGKTTFANGAPRPYFLFTDRKGHRSIPMTTPRVFVTAWDKLPAESGEVISIMGTLRRLRDEEHSYRTVVIDTINRAQFFLWRYLCALYQVKSIELVGGGYGKGFTAALEQVEEMISLLFDISDRGLHVIVISQQQTKTASNPLGEEYEKFALQLNEKVGGALLSAGDANLFAEPEILSTIQGKGDLAKKRGGQTGVTRVYTRPRAGIDAKNRDFLPPEMTLSWAVFEQEAKAGGLLREALFTRLATLDTAARAEADKYLGSQGWSRSAVEQVIAGIEAPAASDDTEGDEDDDAQEGETDNHSDKADSKATDNNDD